MQKTVLIASICGLIACMPASNDTPKPAPGATTCPAEDLQNLVGQAFASYDWEKIDGKLRILPPGSMMTMDHNPARTNVDTDKHGFITRIWCG